MFTTLSNITSIKKNVPVYQLQPNGKIMLIEDNGRIKVYQKKEYLNIDNLLIKIIKKDLIYLEELLEDRKNNIQLFIISHINKNECLIEFCNLNVKSFNNQNIKRIHTKNIPQKISSSYYFYQDQNNKFCFVNKFGDTLELEKEAKEFLQKNDLKLNHFEIKCFAPKKNPNIFEVTLQIEDVETLHFYLKIDDKIKVFKTFVSEMSGSKEYNLSLNNSADDYIDFVPHNFWYQLINHSLREEIKYIKEFERINQERQKNKIRYKMREKIINHNK